MEKLTKLNNFYEHISQVYPPERVSNSQQYYLTTFLNLWLANISYQISNNNPDYINSLSDLKDSSQEDFLLNWINTIQSPIDFIAHLPKLKYLVRDINIGYFQSLFKEINSADSALASGGSGGIVEIPTGGGKTLLIALTILSMPKFKKIVINTHRITLAKQMIAELKEVFPKHIKIYYCFSSNDSEFLKNNTRYADSEDKSEYSVVVTVTPSLIGLGEEFLNQLDFAFWDESHKYVSSDSFKLTVNQENLAHLCLSATPIPSSIVDLPGSIPVIHGATLIYILPSKIPPEKLIYKYPLIRAIENGNLAPLHWETLQPKDIDYSSFILGSESIDHNTGDYKESVVNEFAEKNQSPILNAIINEINDNQVYFSSSWSMVACQRIKTSIEYAEQVHRETNIPTMVVSSKENIIYFQGKAIETSFHKVLRFHQSMPSIIFQVDTLSEGYDDTRLKNLFLSLVTSKPDKFIQLIGRVLRINPNDPTKIAKVYSFGNPELLYGSLTVPTSLGIPNYIEGEINTSGVKFKETKIPNSSSTKRSETGRKEIDPDLDRVFYQKFVRIEGKLLELDSILKQLNISDNELIKKAEAIIKAEMQKNGLEKKVYVIEKGGFILYNPVVIFLLKKDILDHYSTKILSLPMYQNKITDSRLASELKIKVSALKKVLKLCFASSSLVCKDENLDVVLISKNLIPEITKIIQQLKQNNYYKYIELRSFFTKNPKYYEEISTEIIASLNKGVIPAEFTGDLEINVFETFFALTFKKNSLKSIIPRQYVQLITDWAESLYSKYSQDALVITHKDPRVKNINFKILGAICQELNIEYITATNKAKTLPLTISIDGQEHSVLKLIQEMLKELTSVPTGIVSTYRFFKPVPKNIITAYVNEHKCKKYIFQSDYYGAYISYGVPEDAFDEYLEKIEIAETMASNIDSQSDYFHPSLLFRKANEIYKKYDESNSLTSFIASFKEAFNNNPQYFQELNLGYYNNNTSEICLTRSYFDLLFEQMEFWQNKKYIFYQFQNYLSSKFSESKFTQCNLSDISLYLKKSLIYIIKQIS
jgi:superfamily II DNA or RNA helicase